MLHDIFLLFCICARGVTSTSFPPVYSDTTTTAMTTATTEAAYLYVRAMASPEYPVAAGQTVKLYCSFVTNMPTVSWYWQYQIKETWQDFGNMMNLTLTEPNQTGTYRCYAKAESIGEMSNTVTVYIVAMQPTVGDNLGIAAIVLSVLALIMAITILIWWGLQKYGGTMTTTNTAVKGFPEPGKIPKGDFPQTGGDGDVYMNYTSTSQAYTNLDPTNMTADNIYSRGRIQRSSDCPVPVDTDGTKEEDGAVGVDEEQRPCQPTHEVCVDPVTVTTVITNPEGKGTHEKEVSNGQVGHVNADFTHGLGLTEAAQDKEDIQVCKEAQDEGDAIGNWEEDVTKLRVQE
ncbi:hypothetical protein INR49_019870, partial [Caranx melampygus]